MMQNSSQSPDNSAVNEGQQQQPELNTKLSNEHAMRIAAEAINSLKAGTSPCSALLEAARPYLDHVLTAEGVKQTFEVVFRDHDKDIQQIVEQLDARQHDIYARHQELAVEYKNLKGAKNSQEVQKREAKIQTLQAESKSLHTEYSLFSDKLESQLGQFYMNVATLFKKAQEDMPLEAMMGDWPDALASAKQIVDQGLIAFVSGKNASISKFNKDSKAHLKTLDVDSIVPEADYPRIKPRVDRETDLSAAKIDGEYLGRGHHYREIPGLAGRQVELAPGISLTQEKASVKNVFTGADVVEDVLFVTFKHSDSSYVKVPVELDMIAREKLGKDPSFEDVEAEVNALDISSVTTFLRDKVSKGNAALFFNEGLTQQLSFDVHSKAFRNIFALADGSISELKGVSVVGRIKDSKGDPQDDHTLSGLEFDRVKPIDSKGDPLEQLRDVRLKHLVLNSLSCEGQVFFGGDVTIEQCDLYKANLNGLTPPMDKSEKKSCSLTIKRCNLDKADLGEMKLGGMLLRSLRFHYNYNPTRLPTDIDCFTTKPVTKDGRTYIEPKVKALGFGMVFKGTQFMPSNETFGRYTNTVVQFSYDTEKVSHWAQVRNPDEVLEAIRSNNLLVIPDGNLERPNIPRSVPIHIFEETVDKFAFTKGSGGQGVDLQVRQNGSWRRLEEEDELANIKVIGELEALRNEELSGRDIEAAFTFFRRNGERDLKNLRMEQPLNPKEEEKESAGDDGKQAA